MTPPPGSDSNDPSGPGASGNRWEPAQPQDRSSDETVEQPPAAQPVSPAEQLHGDPFDEQPTRVRRSRAAALRRQAPVAAVGAAFLLGGGVAGYAVGHATAGEDDGFDPASQHSTPNGGDSGPGDGFGRHDPDQGDGGRPLGEDGSRGGPGSGEDSTDSSGTPS